MAPQGPPPCSYPYSLDSSILCFLSHIYRNRTMVTIVVVVKLVVVTKDIPKGLDMIKPFGRHLPAWYLVPTLHVWPLQIFQRPICSHHKHDVVRILGSHNMVDLITNYIGKCIHVTNLLSLHVPNNLLCRHPLWPVVSFLNQRWPQDALFNH